MTILNGIQTYVNLIKNNPNSTIKEIATLAKELPIFKEKPDDQIKREISCHASTHRHGIYRINSEDGPTTLGIRTDEEEEILNEEIIADEEESESRREIERRVRNNMTPTEKYDYDEFWEISKKLNNLGLSLDVDHAKSIKEFGDEAITSKNLQLLMERANKKKNKSSMDRITWELQLQVIKVAQISARADQDLVNRLMDRLKVVW